MTKSQLYPAPSMNQSKKQWKCNQLLIKMNFGAKIFFEKSPTFHHHPGLAQKNASRVVIKNGQTVQFQVLKTFIFEFRTMENH